MTKKDDDDDVPSAASSLIKLERLARLLRQAGHTQGLNWATASGAGAETSLQTLGHTQGLNWADCWAGIGLASDRVIRIRLIMKTVYAS